MTDAWQSAWVEVLPDFSKFKAKTNAAIAPVLSSAGDTGGGLFGGGFLKSVGAVFGGATLASLAIGAGRLVGDAIGAGINYGLDSIDLASKLQQSSGAVDVIFKDSAKVVNKYAKAASKSLGLSENSYNELASVIGAQLKNGGTSINDLSKKTNDLITIGGDLSAQFGGSTKDAVDALSSALKGERDPIERYGVSLNQNAINAKAAALGYKQVNGTLSSTANQAATLALILDQTRDAAGQFEAQSGTLAEKQQILAAGLENAKTKIGTALLPAFTGIVTYANDTLLPKLGDIIAAVGPKFSQALTDAAPSIDALLTKVGPLVDKFTTAATDAIPGFIKGMGDIVNAAPAWVDAFTFLNDPNSQPAKFLNELQANLANAGLAFHPFFQAGVDGLSQSQSEATTLVTGFVGSIKQGLDGLVDPRWSLAGPLNDLQTNLNNAGLSVHSFLVDAVGGLGQSYNEALGFVGGFLESVRTFPAKAVGVLAGIGTTLFNSGKDLVQGLLNGAGTILPTIGKFFLSKLPAFIVEPFKLALGIKSPSKVFAELGGYIGAGLMVGLDRSQAGVASSIRSLVSVPDATARVDASVFGSSIPATTTGTGGNVIIEKIVAPDEDPRIAGSIIGRQVVKALAG